MSTPPWTAWRVWAGLSSAVCHLRRPKICAALSTLFP